MSSRPWLIYTLLRIGMFAVVFAVLALTGVNPILAALIAAIVGLCVTYIFFRGQRDQVVTSFAQWRTSSRKDGDADAEDDVLDRADDTGKRHPRSSEGESDPRPWEDGRSPRPSEGERDR